MTAKTQNAAKLWRTLLTDIRPLQESPAYRRLWIGSSLSMLGSQITLVAVPIQVYALTHSSLAVGLLGLAEAVPLLVVGLLGGTLADALDRRTLVLITGTLLVALSSALAIQAAAHVGSAVLLYALVVMQSAVSAVSSPARQAFIPRLLRPERIAAAAALSQTTFQVALLIGPLVAGIVIATYGLQAAYGADAVSFVVALYPVFRLPPMPPAEGGARRSLASVVEGLRFLRRRPVLAGALLSDTNSMIFGMPKALFPALAATHFGGGARTVGLLYAAIGMGGLATGTLSGSFRHVRRQGLAMLVAAVVWGLATAGFALTSMLWVAMLLLAAAGAADVAAVVFRWTILQVNTPDALQGRVSSVSFIVGRGAPALGDVEAGAVAAVTSPVFSAFSGGLACIAGAVLLVFAVPALARYQAPDHEAR